MKVSSCVNEALQDISTENKLYHRTNLEALIKILQQKKLKGFKYIDNVERKIKGYTDPYLQIKYPEIATARKDAFTTIDRSGPKYKERLSLGVGAIEFELYKDRIRTLRSVNIEPLDEYRAREREERIVLKKVDYIPVNTKYMTINIKPKDLDKDYRDSFDEDISKKIILEDLITLRKLIRENLYMFNKDHNFRYFIAWLEDKMKELRE